MNTIKEQNADALQKIRARLLRLQGGSGGDASAANQLTEIGHLSAIETLLGTIDAVLDSIDATNTNMETVLIAIDGSLDTIDTNIGIIRTEIEAIKDNAVSKIQRIKGATNYSRAITYYGTTENPTIIVHTGTTDLGSETVTETITYVDAVGGDFRASGIVYS